MNSLFSSWFHREFIIFNLIHYLIREFTMNPLSFSRNHNEFTILFVYHCEYTIFFENLLWIHYLSRDISLNSLSVSLNHYKIAIYFVNLLYIENQFRGFGLNQLFSPRINSDITSTLVPSLVFGELNLILFSL